MRNVAAATTACGRRKTLMKVGTGQEAARTACGRHETLMNVGTGQEGGARRIEGLEDTNNEHADDSGERGA